MRTNCHAVILAGGPGHRLWPRSRESRPKQLLPLVSGGRTLLQDTALRLAALVPPERILVSANRVYAAEVRRQLPRLKPESLLTEPLSKDTGPAVALAAATIYARTRDPQAVILFVPSDHWVGDPAAYREALLAAAALAAGPDRRLVIVGVPPTRPETGFGYIEPGRPLAGCAGGSALEVKRFVEKPGPARAARFARRGRHLWNCGLLVCTAGTILDALARYEPALGGELQAMVAACAEGDDARLAQAFDRVPAISVERAVLERASNLVVVPARFGWDDLGGWGALGRLLPADPEGNVALGRTVTLDAADCIVDAGGKPVCLLGVRGLVVVDAGDVLLVADRRRGQDVRALRELVREAGLGHLM